MSFKSQIQGWATETEERLLAVFRRSVELLAEEMTRTASQGGTLPHVTGNLMRSLLAQIGSMPATGGPEQRYAGSDVGLVVAQAMLDTDIFLGFQAIYARRMNYGFVGTDSAGRTYEQAGRHFVERAVKLWPQIVKKAVAEVKAGAGA